MADEIEEHLIKGPRDERERAALRCLLRARSEGRSSEETASVLAAETGITLSPEAVTRVLEAVAGPIPRESGGDPEFFSGHLGGG